MSIVDSRKKHVDGCSALSAAWWCRASRLPGFCPVPMHHRIFSRPYELAFPLRCSWLVGVRQRRAFGGWERASFSINQRLSLISAYSNFCIFCWKAVGSVNGLYSCFQTRAGEGPGAGSAPVWIHVFLRGCGLASMNVGHERACSRFASNVHLSLFSVFPFHHPPGSAPGAAAKRMTGRWGRLLGRRAAGAM